MSEHIPTIKTWVGESGCGVSCSCGWSDPYLWGEQTGARAAFANHVLDAVLPSDWPAFLAEEASR